MKFFIDTADTDVIREAQSKGWVDGVTTNPSLVAQSGKPMEKLIAEICEMVPGPVSAEVLSTSYEDMLVEGRKLAAIASNVVVKVPLTEDGLRAVHSFTEEDIQTNVTLCFSPMQALLAAKAGATMISPFVGRLDDISHQGMELVEQICQIYDNYLFDTEVLVASVRSPMHMLQATQIGADIATLPYKVLKQLVRHPLTDLGLEQFLKDAQSIPKA